jgi:myo-inositol-1(or 4)-monophosphatase
MTRRTSAELLDLAAQLAREAGALQLEKFRTFDPREARLKGRRNPVTAADVESEKRIVAGIKKAFRRDRIHGEEGGVVEGSTEYEWIVDPLDGTVNYAHGLPVFSVSIAVQRAGRTVAGVVYAPALGELYTACLGEGSFLNGDPIRVSACPDLVEALLATGFSYHRNEVADNNVRHFTDLVMRCRDVRRLGSAALDLAYVASGRLDAYWELHLSRWDIAAGILLVEEAGGKVTDLTGGATMLESGQVLASNGSSLHEQMQAALAS